MVIWRGRAFAEGEFDADLTVGATGGAEEVEGADSGRVEGVG